MYELENKRGYESNSPRANASGPSILTTVESRPCGTKGMPFAN
jgi:hypothetical protein